MTTYQRHMHEACLREWTAAKALLATATTRIAKRDAAEAVEFWGSKLAMLSVSKGW